MCSITCRCRARLRFRRSVCFSRSFPRSRYAVHWRPVLCVFYDSFALLLRSFPMCTVKCISQYCTSADDRRRDSLSRDDNRRGRDRLREDDAGAAVPVRGGLLLGRAAHRRHRAAAHRGRLGRRARRRRDVPRLPAGPPSGRRSRRRTGGRHRQRPV